MLFWSSSASCSYSQTAPCDTESIWELQLCRCSRLCAGAAVDIVLSIGLVSLPSSERLVGSHGIRLKNLRCLPLLIPCSSREKKEILGETEEHPHGSLTAVVTIRQSKCHSQQV